MQEQQLQLHARIELSEGLKGSQHELQNSISALEAKLADHDQQAQQLQAEIADQMGPLPEPLEIRQSRHRKFARWV